MDGPIPTITFSQRVHHAMAECMKLAVVVKMLGRFIRQDVLHRKITALWNPQGTFKLTELEGGCYMIRFGCEADYTKAVLSG